MALNSNALITVADLQQYMRSSIHNSELFSIYHDKSGGATAATVTVTATQLTLHIVGGTGGDNTFNIWLLTTVTALVAAINALAKGWVAFVTGNGNASATQLEPLAESSAYGVENAKYILGADTSGLESAINEASQMIETWCGRSFKTASYRHLYHGKARKNLMLRQYPVTAVTRVSIGRRKAAQIGNSSTDCIDATAMITDAALILTVNGGTNNGTVTCAYDGTTTLTQMQALVTAGGKGWTFTVDSQAQGSWLFSNVFRHQARSALNPGIDVFVPNENLDRYEVNYPAGILTRAGGNIFQYVDPLFHGMYNPYELRPVEAQGAGPMFPDGVFNICVFFTAGYATVPADLQEICKELAANILYRATRDTSLKRERVEGYEWEAGEGPASGVFESIRNRLSPHKMYNAPEFVEI